MKHRLLPLPTMVAVALLLGSCAPEVPPRVAFNEAAFAAARLKLDRLEAAATIGDLAALPGNRFENRKGQCSIRVNDQWRICFEWPAGCAPDKAHQT
jgi:plasmid maintenance system killer protein